MKIKKIFIAVLVAMLTLTGVVALLPQTTEVVLAKTNHQYENLELEVGQSKKLKVNGASKMLKWSSSDPSVATVNKKGKVTAVSKGLATIIGKTKGIRYTCFLTVGPIEITLDNTYAEIGIGETITLTAKTDPEFDTIKWSSSNNSVATVNNGMVKGIRDGYTIISASVGTYEAKCKVVVSGINISLPSLPLETSYLSKGEKYLISDMYVSTELFPGKTDEYVLKFYITGEKIEGSDSTSSTLTISYKIYDSYDCVTESGTIFGPSLAKGEKFRDVEEYVGNHIKAGKYRIEILDTK